MRSAGPLGSPIHRNRSRTGSRRQQSVEVRGLELPVAELRERRNRDQGARARSAARVASSRARSRPRPCGEVTGRPSPSSRPPFLSHRRPAVHQFDERVGGPGAVLTGPQCLSLDAGEPDDRHDAGRQWLGRKRAARRGSAARWPVPCVAQVRRSPVREQFGQGASSRSGDERRHCNSGSATESQPGSTPPSPGAGAQAMHECLDHRGVASWPAWKSRPAPGGDARAGLWAATRPSRL